MVCNFFVVESAAGAVDVDARIFLSCVVCICVYSCTSSIFIDGTCVSVSRNLARSCSLDQRAGV